jgi:hypothetical protein
MMVWYPRPDDERKVRDHLIDQRLNGIPLTPGELRTWYQELWRLDRSLKPEVWDTLKVNLDNETFSDIRREYILIAREEVDAMLKWRIHRDDAR